MKTLSRSAAALVVLTIAISALARADTLPAGATRFNYYSSMPPTIDVPEGMTLVITDVVAVAFAGACLILDGDQPKLSLRPPQNASAHVGLQTGIEFHTQLRADGSCSETVLSGYWLNLP